MKNSQTLRLCGRFLQDFGPCQVSILTAFVMCLYAVGACKKMQPGSETKDVPQCQPEENPGPAAICCPAGQVPNANLVTNGDNSKFWDTTQQRCVASPNQESTVLNRASNSNNLAPGLARFHNPHSFPKNSDELADIENAAREYCYSPDGAQAVLATSRFCRQGGNVTAITVLACADCGRASNKLDDYNFNGCKTVNYIRTCQSGGSNSTTATTTTPATPAWPSPASLPGSPYSPLPSALPSSSTQILATNYLRLTFNDGVTQIEGTPNLSSSSPTLISLTDPNGTTTSTNISDVSKIEVRNPAGTWQTLSLSDYSSQFSQYTNTLPPPPSSSP